MRTLPVHFDLGFQIWGVHSQGIPHADAAVIQTEADLDLLIDGAIFHSGQGAERCTLALLIEAICAVTHQIAGRSRQHLPFLLFVKQGGQQA